MKLFLWRSAHNPVCFSQFQMKLVFGIYYWTKLPNEDQFLRLDTLLSLCIWAVHFSLSCLNPVCGLDSRRYCTLTDGIAFISQKNNSLMSFKRKPFLWSQNWTIKMSVYWHHFSNRKKTLCCEFHTSLSSTAVFNGGRITKMLSSVPN